ncbi:MAG: acyl-CoA dehydrogenase [Actinomycetia bacterium]|nr:acyl-CoA dehydrogenase [Actinomycetes bacterium]MCP5033062.1 acyl-CoA dehydrogenase [Actinomycetes bacterium]
MSTVMGPEEAYEAALAWYRDHWDPELSVGGWWQLLADSGWAFPSWPAGWGGQGLSVEAAMAATRARREVGAYPPPSTAGTFLTAPTMFEYGTEDQIRKFLPGIVNGQDMWCQLFSEPGSGSDMASLSTRAELDGDEWVVNGQKVWNSGAQYAKYAILIARTDPDQPKHRGITFFLFDMEQDGVEVRPLREMTGEAAFNEVFLSDARVSDADRLGDLGEGWRVAMTTLSHERDPDNVGMDDSMSMGEIDLSVPVGVHAAQSSREKDGFALWLSGGTLDLLYQVVDSHGASADPVQRQRLMRILEMWRTSEWSGQRSAAATETGGPPGPEISTLKIAGSNIGRQARDTGLAALGPHGMLMGDDAPDNGVFHSYAMFTPAISIAGGTDEVQRNIIGERVLGLPREPGEAEQRQLPWSELKRS